MTAQIPTLDQNAPQVDPAPAPDVSPTDVQAWSPWIKDSFLTPNNIVLTSPAKGVDHTDKLAQILARMVLSMGATDAESANRFFTPEALTLLQSVAGVYVHELNNPTNVKNRVNWGPFNDRKMPIVAFTQNGSTNNDISVVGHTFYSNLVTPVMGESLKRWNERRSKTNPQHDYQSDPFMETTLVNAIALPIDPTSTRGFINAVVYNLTRSFEHSNPIAGEVYPRFSIESFLGPRKIVPQVIRYEVVTDENGQIVTNEQGSVQYVAKNFEAHEIDNKDLERYTKVCVNIHFYQSKSEKGKAYAGSSINSTIAMDEVVDGQVKPVKLRDLSASSAAINQAVAGIGAQLGVAVDVSGLNAGAVRTLDDIAVPAQPQTAPDAFTSPTAPVAAPAAPAAPSAPVAQVAQPQVTPAVAGVPGAVTNAVPGAVPGAVANASAVVTSPAPAASGQVQLGAPGLAPVTQAPVAAPVAPSAPVAPAAPSAPVAPAAPVAPTAPVAAPAGAPAPVAVATGSPVATPAVAEVPVAQAPNYNLADPASVAKLAQDIIVENSANAGLASALNNPQANDQVRQTLLNTLATSGSTIAKDVLDSLNPQVSA